MITRTQFPHYPEHVPDELKRGRYWVCCDPEKVPLVAFESKRASSTDPATWRSYADCLNAWRAHPDRYCGLGRVIVAGDPYVGVDVDDERDPLTGKLSPRAVAFLALLESYSEVSPSGTGFKTWVRADLARSFVKDSLEVYRGSRFFTITGQILVQAPLTIEPRTPEVQALVEREFPEAPPAGRELGPYDGPELELGEFLENVHVFGSRPDGLGTKLQIRCPWISEHTGPTQAGRDGGTYIGQMRNGSLWFRCWHAHCTHRGWTEFRQYVRLEARRLELIREGAYE